MAVDRRDLGDVLGSQFEAFGIDRREQELAGNLLKARKISLVGRAMDEVSSNTGRGARLGQNTGVVTFEVQPAISESGTATYTPIDNIRQAASMLIYMGSPSREFSINAKFVSRTRKEAFESWEKVQTLRSWRTPEAQGGDFNVTTPSRLELRGLSGWFNEISVRMVSLSVEMPEDVDYIKADNGYDVPIVWPVNITLKEARSANELKDFSISQYRRGKLPNW